MPKRVLLDWNEPLLPVVAQRLIGERTSPYTDLGDTLVIVPTSQAARRLRERLAMDSKGRGLFLPIIQTPDQFLNEAARDPGKATPEDCVAAWVNVLSRLGSDSFKAVFPVEPVRSSQWALGMAQRFVSLRQELGRDGLDFRQVSESEGAAVEAERWRQLGELERRYLDELKLHDLKDPEVLRRGAAEDYEGRREIRRFVLAATPDPQELVIRALGKVDCEVWIYADDLENFDDWGRPLAGVWSDRLLPFEEWGCAIRTHQTPRAVAEDLVRHLEGQAPEAISIGLADPRLNAAVAEEMEAAGIPHFDPEGQPLRCGSVGRLAELMQKALEDRSTPAIRDLLLHPFIGVAIGAADSGRQHIAEIDTLFEQHRTADLDSLLHFAKSVTLKEALTSVGEMLSAIEAADSLPMGILETLQEIYSEAPESENEHERRNGFDQASAIRDILIALTETQKRFGKHDTELESAMVRTRLRSARFYPQRPKDAHDLKGWLELLWDDAPYLTLAGLNETVVPDTIQGDAFLPDGLRTELELRSNEQRFHRDTYLLEAACRKRRANGKVDILVPRTAADGSPLKPSRLLFLTPDDQLVQRTRKLIGGEDSSLTKHVVSTAPKLEPPKGLPRPKQLSVSSIRDYLNCPFRYFLKHVLRMCSIDAATRELDGGSFGSVFHDTVDHLKGARIDSSVKAEELEKTLIPALKSILRNRYGKEPSFAIRIQEISLQKRIAAFCQRQIEDVQENGSIEILETEKAFELPLGGTVIRGRIDRIDQRGLDIELIDYKTSETKKTPTEAHLKNVPKAGLPAHVLPEAVFDDDRGSKYWIDLQLPLYLLAERHEDGSAKGVAYFNLPKSLDKAGIDRWSNLTDEHLASAKRCAEAIIERVHSGVFWPPNSKPGFDEFAHLFPDGIENAVNADAFQAYSFSDADD